MARISGLDEREEEYPCIGAIRKGAAKGDNRPGKDLHYFRLDFDKNEKALAESVAKKHGENPDRLDILLPPFPLHEVWSVFNEFYVGSVLVHRCDPNKNIVLKDLDPRTLEPRKLTDESGLPRICTGYRLTDKNNNVHEEKSECRLKIMLRGTGRPAYLLVRSHSVNDAVNIERQLKALLATQRLLGKSDLSGIPLVLKRVPKMVPAMINGKRTRVEKYLISIEADESWYAEVEKVLAQRAQPNSPVLRTRPLEDTDGWVIGDRYEEAEDDIDPALLGEDEPTGENFVVNSETGEIIEGGANSATTTQE
jgi:hypothetical protein